MSTLIPPRYELPIIDAQSGRMSREWYKYLVQLGNSISGSPTLASDLTNLETADSAAVEAFSLTAMGLAREAESIAWLGGEDLPKTPDVSLLAWWPQ